MGAVRRFPTGKRIPQFRGPCVPASKHHFVEVQRNPVREKVEGDYIILFRCLHCANSVFVQTKRYNRAALMNPRMKKWPLSKRWWMPSPVHELKKRIRQNLDLAVTQG